MSTRDFLTRNRIILNQFDTEKHVHDVSRQIDHLLEVESRYINASLDKYEFESTFNGLAVHVDNNATIIQKNDVVHVMPLTIVFIGEFKYNPQSNITRVVDVVVRGIGDSTLTGVDTLVHTPNNRVLTSATNLTSK